MVTRESSQVIEIVGASRRLTKVGRDDSKVRIE